MKKRIITFLMAASLCVSSVSFSVWAEAENKAVTEKTIETTALDADSELMTKSNVDLEVETVEESVRNDAMLDSQVYDTGTCGDNVTWTLYDEGTLVISGTGEMADFYHLDDDNQFWYHRNKIKNAIIEYGVTSIGSIAFADLSNLTSITIPNSVTYIDSQAFSGCCNLENITNPESVTSIGDFVFDECTSLTGITIPNSVTSISSRGLFRGCSSLTNITIPGNIELLHDSNFENAFAYCSSLTNITLPDAVTRIGENAFTGCERLTSVTIPNNVEGIDESAFSECHSLEKITIPDSVTSIEDHAFSACYSLTEITIPDSVTNIGTGAFSECHSLTEITIPDSVTYLGAGAFSECLSLRNVSIGEGVDYINAGAFEGCRGLTSITIPNSAYCIDADSFSGCSSLTSITIPNTVDQIHSGAFKDCSSLKDVYYLDSEEKWKTITIGDLNDPLLNATIHFNSSGSETPILDDDQIIVVSLGDSYSSGEGIEPFYGQDKDMEEKVNDKDWLAHRSQNSWPAFLKIPGIDGTMRDYEYRRGDDKGEGCTWYFKAASGAETEHFNTTKQKKTVKQKGVNNHDKFDRYLPLQLDIFDEIEDDVDYVTLTVGGNDVDFADIITTCVTRSTYLGSKALEEKMESLWGNIDTTQGNIRNVYYDIRKRTSPETKIIVAGYPELLDYNGKGKAISQKEAALVNSNVHKFNEIIGRTIDKCGGKRLNYYYVDVETAFSGHQAYSSDPWINPVIWGPEKEDLEDVAITSSYSMHPNETGAKNYAKCVSDKIKWIEENK